MTSGIDRHARSKPAFTLLELLVVIFIVGLLTMLTLNAISAARESARRASCMNNLKQMGLAVHSYAESHGCVPMGNSGMAFSVHTAILPYLSQGVLYNAVNFSVPAFQYFDPNAVNANATVMLTVVSTYLCPSDSQSSDRGWTSYAGNLGCGVQKYGYNGAFVLPMDQPLTFSAFSDGTSHTVLCAEWVRGPGKQSSSDERRLILQVPDALTAPGEIDAFARRCRDIGLSPTTVGSTDKGKPWIHGELGTTLYNHLLNINDRSCYNGGLVQLSGVSAGSNHPGGANVLFADGQVRFMKETIDTSTWRAFGSRNGGEVISIE